MYEQHKLDLVGKKKKERKESKEKKTTLRKLLFHVPAGVVFS
jgi:hypothetical protein